MANRAGEMCRRYCLPEEEEGIAVCPSNHQVSELWVPRVQRSWSMGSARHLLTEQL